LASVWRWDVPLALDWSFAFLLVAVVADMVTPPR
jgi:hypothetical protein